MSPADTAQLQTIDWIVIGGYLLVALAAGLLVRERASADKHSYFLADRSLPWWWSGLSIAATTFAADTPLAVTGIVANKGLSGNWIWLSWIGVHAAVVVFFAGGWHRSGALTDAELISLRYSGRHADVLRTLRAGIYGIVYNSIILGWVLRAMVKIVSPFFHWERWAPRLIGGIASVWPADGLLGGPAEGLTILALLTIVAIYSSMGGIRGVILTDLLQLTMALVGSVWLAGAAYAAVGGHQGLINACATIKQTSGTDVVSLFPSTSSGWLAKAGVGLPLFGLYLFVQSYANVPADGGGYLMQRLNCTRRPGEAQRAALLFIVLQYLVRSWPWFVVALAALVLIPLGSEATALGGLAQPVAHDRELAYPILMVYLLPPFGLGLMVASLLAAFMSTIDTHINWGASYLVNDVLCRVRPQVSARGQVRAARVAVVAFAAAAVLVSSQIATIEQAWQWVAALGAALGIPTALRWLWWRVNATGELGAIGVGLGTTAVLQLTTDLSYELRLVLISAASVIGMGLGMLFGPATDREQLRAFVERVQPRGFWPGHSRQASGLVVSQLALRWIAVIGGVVLLLTGTHHLLLRPWSASVIVPIALGLAALWWGAQETVSEQRQQQS